jgi:hypothetical protein
MPSVTYRVLFISIGAIVGCLTLGVQWQTLAPIASPLLLAAHGLHTNKLTRGGACMSVAVGWLLIAAGLKYFITVMTFYVLGTAATKFRSVAKTGIVSEGGGGSKTYGQRGAQQVAIKGDVFDCACIKMWLSDPSAADPRSDSSCNLYHAIALRVCRRLKRQQYARPRHRLPCIRRLLRRQALIVTFYISSPR